MANLGAIAEAAKQVFGLEGEVRPAPRPAARHTAKFKGFHGAEFETKTIKGFKFVIVPKGFRLYKGMKKSIPKDFFANKPYPHPSYYSVRKMARPYIPRATLNQDDFRDPSTWRHPTGFRKVKPFAFETKRDLLLFRFDDEDNIRLLGEMLSDPEMNPECQRSSLPMNELGVGDETYNAETDLYLVTGFKEKGFGCDQQKDLAWKMMLRIYDTDPSVLGREDTIDFPMPYHFNESNCDKIRDTPLHRLSVAKIDDQVSRNLCCIMAELGIDCDGYIADRWGSVIGGGWLHEEVMLCYLPDAMKIKWRKGERWTAWPS